MVPDRAREIMNSSGTAVRSETLAYVLITPARNEEKFIEQTIQSVIRQTVLPRKWVIVSDGSTDRTDDIARTFLADHPWISLIRMPERRERHFAAKARCFEAGYERVRREDFNIIGNLDADITFGPDHFEFLLGKFAADPSLGVAGTAFVEGTASYDFRFASVEHVSGACQLFRRQCFEEIGGYQPVMGGGIDWIAVTSARMMGWKTRTFVERVWQHRRPMGTASSGSLNACFKLGRRDYYLGGHPLWELFRGCFQMARKPFVLGGLLLLAGYWWALITRVKRPIPSELMRFHRREQMQRLRHGLLKTVRIVG
jgi:glycosyltransferase involved in cell wall biosynthesis